MTPAEPSAPITRAVVLDVEVAPSRVGRIQGRRISMPAGAASGAHTHNGPVVGNVVTGRVRFKIAGGAESVLEPGDVFHEPADVVIEHFDALDDDVVFLAWFPVPAGVEPELLPVEPAD